MANSYRVNCGATDIHVDDWFNDQEYGADTTWGFIGGGCVTREPDLPIDAGALSEIIRNEHHGIQAYVFELDAGTYDLRLICAETFEGSHTPDRAFDIRIGERVICEAFQPCQVAGGILKPAIVVVEGLQHAGGALRIDFSEKALINGIEIQPSAASTYQMHVEAPLKHVVAEKPAPICEKKTKYKILFVGNSGTFFWSVPETTRELLALGDNDVSIEVQSITSGGKRFEWHYCESKTLALLKEQQFDIVVLQDSSGGPLDFHDSMVEYAGKLIEAVRAAGATPLLYAYEGPVRYTSEQRQLVMQRYADIARAHNVGVVPHALALDKAMTALPNKNFHNPDRHHLGMFGGYVAACSFYQVLSGKSAQQHPYPAVLGNQVPIPTDIARILEDCAAEACTEYADIAKILD